MHEPGYSEVYVHFVWGTRDREPLLNGDVERDVHRALAAEALALGCEPVAIGGVPEHVHLLVRLADAIAVDDFVTRVQDASAYLVAHKLVPGSHFKWQADYGAVSISPEEIEEISQYIARQREHHAADTTLADFELLPLHPSSPEG